MRQAHPLMKKHPVTVLIKLNILQSIFMSILSIKSGTKEVF